MVHAPLGHAQAAQFADRSGVSRAAWSEHPRSLTPSLAPSLARATPDTGAPHGSHRRAIVIGGTTGAIIGGLGAAGYILNALAPDCITEVSTGAALSSSHCGHREGIVALETVTIVAGATAGALGGAWAGRRIADWWGRRHSDPLLNGR